MSTSALTLGEVWPGDLETGESSYGELGGGKTGTVGAEQRESSEVTRGWLNIQMVGGVYEGQEA